MGGSDNTASLARVLNDDIEVPLGDGFLKNSKELQRNCVLTLLSELEEEFVTVEFKGEVGLFPKEYLERIELQGIDFIVIEDQTINEVLHFPCNFSNLEVKKGDVIQIITADFKNGWYVGYFNYTVGLIRLHAVKPLCPATLEELKEVLFLEEEGNFPVLECLGNLVSVNECLAMDLPFLFDYHNLTWQAMKSIIQDEINKSNEESTLFRKNSLCSFFIMSYMNIVGKKYLLDTLTPIINYISLSGLSYEVDPIKISESERLEENISNLNKLCQMLFHALMESVHAVPSAMKKICNLLSTQTREKYPKSKRTVVGGFFFLRFLCPALISPESHGVVDSIDGQVRRSLILVSKVFQTLSNGIKFGEKESYMIPINKFISENIENVHYVLDKLSNITGAQTFEQLPTLDRIDYQKLLSHIHSQLYLSLSSRISHNTSFLYYKHFNFVELNHPKARALMNKLYSTILRAGTPRINTSSPFSPSKLAYPVVGRRFSSPEESNDEVKTVERKLSNDSKTFTINTTTTSNNNNNNDNNNNNNTSTSGISLRSTFDLKTASTNLRLRRKKSSSTGYHALSPRNSILSDTHHHDHDQHSTFRPSLTNNNSNNNNNSHNGDNLNSHRLHRVISPRKAEEKELIIPVGELLIQGKIYRKRHNLLWRRQYFSFYSNSVLYFSANSSDFENHLFLGSINIKGNCIQVLGKNKHTLAPPGWEVHVSDASSNAELHLIFKRKTEMLRWLPYLMSI